MKLSSTHSTEKIIEHRDYLIQQITKTQSERSKEQLKLHLNIINEMIDTQLSLKGNVLN